MLTVPEPSSPNGQTMHTPTYSPAPAPALADRPPAGEDAAPEPAPLLGLSPVERAAFDLIAGVADRTLARLRIGERRRVWGHLARLCGDLAAN